MVYAGSIETFLDAVTLIEPWDYNSATPGDKARAERAFSTKELWWKQETVDWLDPHRYRKQKSMSEASRHSLGELKDTFLRTINAPRNVENAAVAASALREIYAILSPLVAPTDHVRVGKLLSSVIHDEKFHGWFVGYTLEFHNDWTGEPAVYVMLLVSDEMAKDQGFQKGYAKAYHQIQEDLLEIDESVIGERFVFISVRTVGEHLMISGKVAA